MKVGKHYQDLHQVKKFSSYIPLAVRVEEEGGTIASPEAAYQFCIIPLAQDGYYYIRGKLTTNRPIRVVDLKPIDRDQRQQQQKQQQQQRQRQKEREREREREDEEEEEEERDGDKNDNDDDEEKEPTLSPFAISPSASPFAPQSSYSSSSSSLLDPLYDFAICQYELYQVLDEDKPSSKSKEEQNQEQNQQEQEQDQEQQGNKESEPGFIHLDDNSSIEGDDAAYKKK